MGYKFLLSGVFFVFWLPAQVFGNDLCSGAPAEQAYIDCVDSRAVACIQDSAELCLVPDIGVQAMIAHAENHLTTSCCKDGASKKKKTKCLKKARRKLQAKKARIPFETLFGSDVRKASIAVVKSLIAGVRSGTC